MTEKTGSDPYGAEKGSLARSEDPEILKKIREGRAKYNKDRASLEDWASNGFVSQPEDYRNIDDVNEEAGDIGPEERLVLREIREAEERIREDEAHRHYRR
jgi:hypothetical protein